MPQSSLHVLEKQKKQQLCFVPSHLTQIYQIKFQRFKKKKKDAVRCLGYENIVVHESFKWAVKGTVVLT